MIVGIDMGGTNIDGVVIDEGKIIKTIKDQLTEMISWELFGLPLRIS